MMNSIKLGLYNLSFGIQTVGTETVCACGLFIIDTVTKLFS
jgi:hypothetical protein